MKKKGPQLCHEHPELPAAYKCTNCEKYLCEQCVKAEAHLFFCLHCSAHARRIPLMQKEPLTYRSAKKKVIKVSQRLSFTLFSHIVVPAAIIQLVGSFLFYLLEIRSLYLEDTGIFKYICLLFVVASVMIARYGKIYGSRSRQRVYIVLLGIATFVALTYWSKEAVNSVINLVIILMVWRFSKRVAEHLDLEEGRIKKPPDKQVHGVKRLMHEDIERRFRLHRAAYSGTPGIDGKEKMERKQAEERERAKQNPTVEVAKLVILAVFVFALGEPVILSGGMGTVRNAMFYVIAFLMASGMVLAASSSIHGCRLVRDAGGKGDLNMVPFKIIIASFLVSLMLITALSLSGITLGESPVPPSGVDSVRPEENPVSPCGWYFELGKFLFWPLLLVLGGLVIFFLIKLGPQLKNYPEKFRRGWKSIGKKWVSLFRFGVKDQKSKAPLIKNPLKIMRGLHDLSPRETVLNGYECLLAFLAGLGIIKPPESTPYEYIYSLPEDLAYLSGPASKITEIYVKAVYSNVKPGLGESRDVLQALEKLRNLLERHKKTESKKL